MRSLFAFVFVFELSFDESERERLFAVRQIGQIVWHFSLEHVQNNCTF